MAQNYFQKMFLKKIATTAFLREKKLATSSGSGRRTLPTAHLKPTIPAMILLTTWASVCSTTAK
jgi:hypothetical protein